MKKTTGSSRSPLKRLLALTLVFALLLPAGMAGTVGAAETEAALTKFDPTEAPATSLTYSGGTITKYSQSGNRNYKWIEIPYGAKRIGEEAFASATYLEKIIIPDSVTYIEPYAFMNCTSLKEITIPGSVTTVGASAFFNCTGLETVMLLYGVNSIEDSAFMNCSSLRTVTVGPSVKQLPESDMLFWDSGTSKGIVVQANQKSNENPGENSAMVDYIGELEGVSSTALPNNSPAAYEYERDANGEITIKGYVGESKTIEIPSTINECPVTQIGDSAFKDSDITEVVLPETLRTIGSNAFAGCKNLNPVKIPDTVTSIGEDAFDNSIDVTLCGSCKALWQFLRERRLIRFIPSGAGSSLFHRVTAKVVTNGERTNGGTLAEGDPDNYFMGGEELTYTVQLNPLDPKLGSYEFKGWTITPAMNIAGVTEAELLQRILGTKNEEETKLALAERSITIVTPEVNITLTAEIEFNPKQKPDPDIIKNGKWSGDSGSNTSMILRGYIGQGLKELEAGTCTYDDGKQVEVIEVTKIGQADGSGGIVFTNPATETITIGNLVDGILPQAFIQATGLTEFKVEDGNAHFKVDKGVLFSKDGKKLLAYPASKSGTSYTLPAGVEEIGAYAFYNCKNLTQIVLNKELKKIGDFAFYNCKGLSSINTDNVTTIGNYAFSGSSYSGSSIQLKEVIMPNVVTIGNHAFEGAKKLEHIKFAESLTTLGSYCFNNCTNLTNLEFAAVNHITEIPTRAFSGNNISTLTLPKTDNSKGIAIGAYAFADSKVERIVISESIKSMASTAFSGCSRLKEYKMGTDKNGKEIIHEKYACLDGVLFSKPAKDEEMDTLMAYPTAKTMISGEENATAYVLPDQVVKIAENAFEQAKFEELKVGEERTKEFHIGSGAFLNSNLRKIDLSKAAGISANAFQSCQKLEEITWPDAIKTIEAGTFRNCYNLKSVEAPKVTKIGAYAFYQCFKLAKAPLHDNLQSIGCSAFAYCSGLTEVNIPNVVFYDADSSVFNSCRGLKAVYVGSPLIPANAFSGCTALETLGLVDGTFPGEKDTSNAYPSGEKRGVNQIAASAFEGCSSLKKTTGAKTAEEKTGDPVMDLSGVGTIGSRAFSSCRSITSLKTGGTQIGEGAFANCTGLVKAEIDTSSVGGSEAFSGCTSLSNLILSDSVTTIGKLAFSGCSALIEIHIPKNLATLGERAFNNCENLESITVATGNEVFEARDPYTVDSKDKPTEENPGSTPVDENPEGAPTEGSPENTPVEGNPGGTQTEENPEGTQAQKVAGSVLYTKSGELYLYPQARKGDTYTVADGVNIHGYAFEGAKYLTRVNIGNEALKKPEGAAVVSLGKALFANCTELTDVYVYNPQAQFGEGVGDGAYLTVFGQMSDEALRKLKVHGWLNSTAERAAFVMSKKGVGFMPLEGVSDGLIVSLEGSESPYEGTITGYQGTDTSVIVTSLIDESFMEEHKNTKLLKNGEQYTLQTGESVNIKTVGMKAFWIDEKNKGKCGEITSVHLPESITTIKTHAFEDCAKLTGIFSVPVGTKTIEPYAFNGCAALVEIRIPETVTIMGGALKDEETGLTEPRVGMFQGCAKLEKITVDKNNAHFSSTDDGILMSKDGKVIYAAPQNMTVENNSYTIPEGVEVIGCSAFAYNTTISNLTIANTVKFVRQHAFQKTKIENIIFRDDIMSTTGTNDSLDIENEAFLDCVKIVNITIPRWLTHIGTDVFKGCTSLESFSMPNDNNLYFKVHDGALYEKDREEGHYELHCVPICMSGDATNTFTIPDVLPDTNIPVRTIRAGAVQGNKKIKKIVIGGNIEHILESAFRECESLNEVEFGKRASEYGITIAGQVFSGTALTSLELPKFVLSLGKSSFMNCGALTTVTVRNRNLVYELGVMPNPDPKEDVMFDTVKGRKINVYGYAGSTTQNYCTEYNVTTFNLLEDSPETYTITAEIENGSVGGGVFASNAEANDPVRFSLEPTNNTYVLDVNSVEVVLVGKNEGMSLPLKKLEGEGNWYSFTMPAQNVKIKASFVQKETYSVTVANCDHAIVTCEQSAVKLYAGDTVTVTVTPDPGYQVDQVTANSSLVEKNADGKYSFEMPAANVVINVSVSEIKYNISLNKDAYGKVEANKTSAAAGEIVTLSPSITAGYGTSYEIKEVNAWFTNDRKHTVEVDNKGNGVYTFVMPASDVTVEPNISLLYKIDLNYDESMGVVRLEPDSKYAKLSDTITVIAEPKEGYEDYSAIITVSEANNETQNLIPLDSLNSFTMKTCDVVINVKFEKGATASEDPDTAD